MVFHIFGFQDDGIYFFCSPFNSLPYRYNAAQTAIGILISIFGGKTHEWDVIAAYPYPVTKIFVCKVAYRFVLHPVFGKIGNRDHHIWPAVLKFKKIIFRKMLFDLPLQIFAFSKSSFLLDELPEHIEVIDGDILPPIFLFHYKWINAENGFLGNIGIDIIDLLNISGGEMWYK